MGRHDVICPETPPAPHTDSPDSKFGREGKTKQKGNSYQGKVLDVEGRPNLASMNGPIELGDARGLISPHCFLKLCPLQKEKKNKLGKVITVCKGDGDQDFQGSKCH